jgi:glycosyltransferase involved in cell wall biosynthesis
MFEKRGMPSINLHIYPNSFKYESRMLKETKGVADANLADEVHIAAMWENGLAEHQYIDEKRQVWRIRVVTHNQRFGSISKIIRYIEWQARIFFKFRTTSIKFINCHSLSVLPIGVLFKILKRSAIVYDTHELETETVGTVGIRRPLSRLVERTLIPFVDAVITVNESIAQWYRNEYRLKNVYTVRNIPHQPDKSAINGNSILKREFSIGNDEILFIYQGVLNYGRGIEILLDTFVKIDNWKHIVFIGFGPLDSTVKQYERLYPNIHFLDAVKPQEVYRYTSGADVGISLIENVCLSYYLSSPNKVFEYIISGLPVIVSDFPEMRRIVDESGCGWKIAVDRNELFSLITTISWDDIIDKRNKALQYRETLDWHQEERVLLHAYRSASETKVC